MTLTEMFESWEAKSAIYKLALEHYADERRHGYDAERLWRAIDRDYEEMRLARLQLVRALRKADEEDAA